MKIKILFLFLLFLQSGLLIAQQSTNTDPNKSFVNINLPRTPESSGFEKYGTPYVNEFTGTPDLSYPIYNLKSRFLEAPITLSYHPGGIKVSQEASWVGLGFDLNVGGRITVETRGSIDFGGSNLYSTQNLGSAMQNLFGRLGNSREVSVLTYASICEGCDPNVTQNIPDNAQAISDMTQYGAGEPDIFRANFLGNSLIFYYDKITGALQWIGEQSLYNISNATDSYGRIISWTIRDNAGVTYYFNQTETTAITLPGNAIIPSTSTSAWLLTKVVHPTGDYILFSYSNYGNSCPAFNISGSINYTYPTGDLTLSSDNAQNLIIQSPYYLTRVETADAAIDFILDNRNDIYGSGSKRLNSIKISDKQTNAVLRTATFNYSYFLADYKPCSSYLNSLSFYLPSPLSASSYLACSDKRLKLDSLSISDPVYQPPYRFFYKNAGWAPDKYSFSQDHWGYYNAVNNSSNGCSFVHLIPNTGLGTTSTLIPPLNSYAISRDCDPTNMQAMTLDSIVYPTGGSTKLIYEPHQSTMLPTTAVTGGGLRVKTIKNYATGILASSTDYSYSPGIYMGTMEYNTRTATLAACAENNPNQITQEKQSTNGTINFSDLLVGYPTVTITQKNQLGQASNGFLVKNFNINTPSYAGGGVGFDLLPAHWPSTTNPYNGNPYSNTSVGLLYAYISGFAPTPNSRLEGKLLQEQYFDNSSTLIKSVNYYYSLANYTNNFYDVKAIQNRVGGFTTGSCGSGHPLDFNDQGLRPVIIFVSPAKSYHTLTDSIVEQTYQGSNIIKQKKAFKYNQFFQPQYETNYNSDGSQSIIYTTTALDFEPPHYPITPAGDALSTGRMNHLLPIEQISMKRKLNGDTLVLRSRYNVYSNTLPFKSYLLETDKPLLYKNQFTPTYFGYPNYPNYPSGGNYDFVIDPKYKLQQTVAYNDSNLIQQITNPQSISAYIWDKYYNNLIAQCTNAIFDNIAYTSFETTATGNWSYTGLPFFDNYAPTGKKVYSLVNGSITKSSIDASKTYLVSYWSKNGLQTVSGTTSTVSGATYNGWTYYEHTVSNAASVTVSGNGVIDELRLYPKESRMVTYTYTPLIGMTSQSDINNRIFYYEYDGSNRLFLIRDQNKNVLKKYCYNYSGQVESCPYVLYSSSAFIQNFIRNNCGSGYVGSTVNYTIPAGRYSSTISQADADAQAQADINANGQNYANQNGTCTQNNCTSNNCMGDDHKCVNGVCEQGTRCNISSVHTKVDGIHWKWRCTWKYCFSDASSGSLTYTDDNDTACSVQGGCVQ